MKRLGRFVEDVLVVVGELDVVGEQNLDVIGAEPLQRRLDALPRASATGMSSVWSRVFHRLQCA